MGCNSCGDDRPVRHVLIRAFVKALDRMGYRDLHALPGMKDILDSAEAEIVAVIEHAKAGA